MELFDNEEENYEDTEMTLGVRIFWDILFGSSIVISILGNISVLWTIIGELQLYHINSQWASKLKKVQTKKTREIK